MRVDRFENLDVWKLARALTTKIYRFAKVGEFSLDYGLRNQICRAAVSIVSNIAEGFERKSDKSFQQFLTIAKGSAGEVRAQLYVAFDLGYISQQQFEDACQDASRISKMLSGLISYLGNPASSDLGLSDLRPLTPNEND